MKFEVVPGDYVLAAKLANDLWDVDREDFKLTLDYEPMQGVIESMQASKDTWFLLRYKKPVACGGICDCGEVGVPWFLATNDIEYRPDVRLKLAFLSRRMIEAAKDFFVVLENRILAKHEKAIRWAKWLGFKVDDPEVWGVSHNLYCRIHQEGRWVTPQLSV